MPSAKLYSFICSFLCGVAVASAWRVPWQLSALMISTLLSLMIAERKFRNVILIGLILFFIGILRLDINQLMNKPLLDPYAGKTFSGKGIVIDEPGEADHYTEIAVSLEGIKKTQNIIIKYGGNERVGYGDEISFSGTLKKPQSFVADNGRIFDYPHYLAKDSIFYIISTSHIRLIGRNKGNMLKAFLFKAKQSFINHIEYVIPAPESSLLGGLTVAGKQLLGVTLEDEYKMVGLIHVVVLSGYNVTIVAEALVALLSFLPSFISYGSGIIGIILFSIMAGGSSTIIRAAIMSIIALIGKLNYKKYDVLRALMISAGLMAFANPLILAYDPSFQLSFLATLGLILFSPHVQDFLEKRARVSPSSSFGQVLSSTIATQLFLLPYLIYSNGALSIVALPANLLVVSFVPLTMLFGFIAASTSYVSIVLSYPFAFISFVLLRYQLRIVGIFSSIPYASVSVGSIPLWLVFLCYVIFILVKCKNQILQTSVGFRSNISKL